MYTICLFYSQPVLFPHLAFTVGLDRKDSSHMEDLKNLLGYAEEGLSPHKFFSGVKWHLIIIILFIQVEKTSLIALQMYYFHSKVRSTINRHKAPRGMR